ncbi:acyloxyacyl hydrolase [Acidithiobacillus sp. CV18-2]|nr:acyloxyacyl hydrolase [Acidithiobacillus sp. MC6.1]MBU2754653.1 acyloxyacyl hydrolase [Acidithiobacillus sp. CV18-3]MBU2758140.1 acyloxyacyl hydrolase [Acidithiobacillus sp. BN09-2]MBU2777423.1 acyloxyacyl hydrolase [Acidithiobacillus sp. CV18-2]MBU2800182.1 acyloxyacyl hydrolase [Acidithiobacillus sp. VAN18-4]
MNIKRLSQNRILTALFFVMMMSATSVVARADDVHIIQGGPAYLSAGIGIFNAVGIHPLTGPNPRIPEIDVEYQSGSKLFGVGALWGIMANTDGGFMGYSGFYSDIAWNHWILTPVLGFGGYSRGRGKDLSSISEFRLELGLAYQFANGGRFGFKIAHISNAYIVSQDPGEDEALVTYSVPISLGMHR